MRRRVLAACLIAVLSTGLAAVIVGHDAHANRIRFAIAAAEQYGEVRLFVDCVRVPFKSPGEKGHTDDLGWLRPDDIVTAMFFPNESVAGSAYVSVWRDGREETIMDDHFTTTGESISEESPVVVSITASGRRLGKGGCQSARERLPAADEAEGQAKRMNDGAYAFHGGKSVLYGLSTAIEPWFLGALGLIGGLSLAWVAHVLVGRRELKGIKRMLAYLAALYAVLAPILDISKLVGLGPTSTTATCLGALASLAVLLALMVHDIRAALERFPAPAPPSG